MTTPTLFIDGEHYVEAKPSNVELLGGYCEECAFGQNLGHCGIAVTDSRRVFGGDCVQRDVIYIKQTKVVA